MFSQEAKKDLSRAISRLPRSDIPLLDELTQEVLSSKDRWNKSADSRLPGRDVDLYFERKGSFPEAQKVILKKALVARIAGQIPARLERDPLPNSTLDLFPASIEDLARSVGGDGVDSYRVSEGRFCDDLRFSLQMTLPCGIVAVDLSSWVPWTSVFFSVSRTGNPGALARYLAMGGGRPWFRIHLRGRYLIERRFDRSFLRIAELLVNKPNVCGMVGTSWFYDPQLLKINPKLAFLQERPLERGAFLLRHTSTRYAVDCAMAQSRHRKELIEDGKYRPISHSILWPREKILAWAGIP